MATTVIVLEDQLNPSVSSLGVKHDHVLMVEDRQLFRGVHPHRAALRLAAMRQAAGMATDYRRGDFGACVAEHVSEHGIDRLVVMQPSTRPAQARVEAAASAAGVELSFTDDNLFLCSRQEFAAWRDRNKNAPFDVFCRDMREAHNLLANKRGQPLGGRWEFNTLARRGLKRGEKVPLLPVMYYDDGTQAVVRDVGAFGFNWPVTVQQARLWVQDFMTKKLSKFGVCQNILVRGNPFAFEPAVFPVLDAGLVRPVDLVRAVEAAYKRGFAPINSVEFFVRRLLFREFCNGLYWHGGVSVPSGGPVPGFFSVPAECGLECLRHVLEGVQSTGYLSSFSRSHVLTNYCVTHGVGAKELASWLAANTVDGSEWFVEPSVFVDYRVDCVASDSSVISKYSDVCQKCRYDHRLVSGENACPFNTGFKEFSD